MMNVAFIYKMSIPSHVPRRALYSREEGAIVL